jgi:hypothetical protein
MLGLVISVFSVSEECVVVTEAEARKYLDMPFYIEERDKLKKYATSFKELDSIIKKIYPHSQDVGAYYTPFDRLYEAMGYMPGGIRLFDLKVFENYKKNSINPQKQRNFLINLNYICNQKSKLNLKNLKKHVIT